MTRSRTDRRHAVERVYLSSISGFTPGARRAASERLISGSQPRVTQASLSHALTRTRLGYHDSAGTQLSDSSHQFVLCNRGGGAKR